MFWADASKAAIAHNLRDFSDTHFLCHQEDITDDLVMFIQHKGPLPVICLAVEVDPKRIARLLACLPFFEGGTEIPLPYVLKPLVARASGPHTLVFMKAVRSIDLACEALNQVRVSIKRFTIKYSPVFEFAKRGSDS